MRDPGLNEAIRAAGGVSELARQIGISQPSVSNWNRVPAERVARGRGSDRRRPRSPAARSLSATLRNGARRRRGRSSRARRNTRCSPTLLARAPDAGSARAACRDCAAMRRRSASRMPRSREAASDADAERVEREFFDLFIGLGRGELLPYGSYYLTGFLHERPLARLRDDLAALGIERAEGNVEPEDHAAILCEIMAGLAERPLAGAARAPTADLREASGALDRPLLRRSGARRSGRLLPPRRHARPRVHGHRDGSLRAAGVRRGRERNPRRERR